MIIDSKEQAWRISLRKPFQPLIDEIMACPTKQLPQLMAANLVWDKPRGYLLHWVPVLNRIDEILESQIKKYGLDHENPKMHQFSLDDQTLVVACLQFTCTLLEHCNETNLQIYSSSDRIYDLIKSATIDVRLHALEVMTMIGERHVLGNPSQYAIPKPAKALLLQIAKSFPPLVPASYNSRGVDPDRKTIVGEHHNYLDIMSNEKPPKWRLLNFQYYKSSSSLDLGDSKEPKEKEANTAKESKSKEKSAKGAKVTPTEGLATFALPEESVRKLTLEQIYDKASEVIPENYWLQFGLVAPVAKAFNNSSYEALELRRKLLQIKFLAIGSISCLCSSQFTSTKLFEAEPYIFSFLVEIINPDNFHKVSREVLFAAIKALEYISLKKVWGNDIIRSMGGNVSHGILFECLRFINKQVKEERSDYYEKEYIHFLNMVGNLINIKSLAQRLTSGGIIHDLVAFFNVKTKYRWTCSAAIHLTSIYLAACPDSLDTFIEIDGFGLLINTIQYEVNTALEYPNTGQDKNTSTHSLQLYSIAFRQANFIRNLLKLVVDLIQSDMGDRLRNLFDSPLLENFNKILTNPGVFGPAILSSTIDSVFYIIHNEPTAFSILNEAGVIDTILDNYESFLLPSELLLTSLPEVIGAVCLNGEGLKKVIEKKTIETYFKSLSNFELSNEMESTTNLGCTFDELGRHYPTLKPIILKETKKLVERCANDVNKRLPGVQFYRSETGSLYRGPDDIENPDASEDAKGDKLQRWRGSEGEALLDNVCSFVDGLLQDSGQWVEIMEISFESWLDLLTISKAPFDYSTAAELLTLLANLKYFDDENRNYGFPPLISRLEKYLKLPEIQEFTHYEGNDKSFFTQLEEDGRYDDATKLIQTLSTTTTLLFTLIHTYVNPYLCFHERMLQLTKLFGDLGMIIDLGRLLGRCIVEETTIRASIPEHLVDLTAPDFISGQESCITVIRTKEEKPKDWKKKHEATNAKFKNSWQLRHLNLHIISNITRLLNSIGRVCMHKRQEFTQVSYRTKAVKMTVELAKVFADLLTRQFSNSYYKSCYILAVSQALLHSITIRERSKDHAPTSLVFAFIQTGVFDLLRDLGIELWQKLLFMDPKKAEISKDLKFISADEGSIVKNTLSHILTIFSKSVNQDYLPTIPVSKLYFHTGYEEESSLVSSLLVQTRLRALELIARTITTQYPLLPVENFANVPSPLLEIMVSIFKVAGFKNERHDVEFVPLDVNNVSPLSSQLEYLQEKGLNNAQAMHYFKHGLDLSEDTSQWPECPQLDLSASEIERIKHAVDEDPRDWSLDHSSYPSKQDLEDQRSSLFYLSPEKWLEFTRNYPHPYQVFRIITTACDEFELSSVLFDQILDLTEKNDRGVKLATDIQLLSYRMELEYSAPIKSDKTLDRFTDFFVKELQYNETNSMVNEEYFHHALKIFEFIMTNKTTPLDSSKASYLASKPFRLDDKTQANILESLLKLQDINNGNTIIALTRVLILFAKDYENAVRIARSQLLKNLVRHSKHLNKSTTLSPTPEAKNQDLDSYRSYLIILMRRCFETAEVLRVNMSNEILALLSTPSRFNRDLNSSLKESFSLVVRNPEIYADVMSENVLLDGYDGIMPLDGKLPIVKVSKDEHKDSDEQKSSKAHEEDVQMKDAEAAPVESTGIVHILLSELMEVIKTDWVSDPKDQKAKTESEEEKKKNDKKKDDKKDKTGELSKNPNFSYASFLLQTLTELLGSYKQSKLEFLTFSKKKNGDLKPRSTALNFFIHQLVPTRLLEQSSGPEFDRRSAISSIAKIALLAMVSSPVLAENTTSTPPKTKDSDLAFIRKFFVDIVLKILKDTSTSVTALTSVKYGKLLDLFELCGMVISSKSRETTGPLLSKNAVKYDQFFISKAIIDAQIPFQITNILADLDLNFPGLEKVIKAALKPMSLLGKTKTDFQELFEEEHQGDNDDDDIVPDEVDDREETPDLFRNSTLGMYDAEYDSEEEEMDYYDDDPLEVLMSGEEISGSDDESSGLSDLESGDEDEGEDLDLRDDYDEGVDEDSEDSDGMDEDSDDMDDIEIIDELNIGSHSDSDDDEDMSGDNSSFYDFEDEEASEYDEEELDGWLEEFGAGEDDDDDSEEEEHDGRSRREGGRQLGLESIDDSDDNLSDVESSLEMDGESHTRRGLNRALPAFERSPTLAVLLDSFLGESGGFRGTIEVNGEEHHIHNFDNNVPGIGRVFGHIFGDKASSEPYKFMYIKSTKERWVETMRLFYARDREEIISVVAREILDRIQDESTKVYRKKKEEADRVRREHEEKIRKKQEEERKRREQEAKEREEQELANPQPHLEPVMVTIGDREVDISGTDIDPEFFEALPDDMREEVFTQHIRERRANASTTGLDAREIDPDFLDALPDQIREEILQQESMARRFSSLGDMRFEDDDEGDEDDEGDLADDNGEANLDGSAASKKTEKAKKVFFTPLVDKQGVASLIRLLFTPLSLSQREQLSHTLEYLCQSKQTRIEVMGLLVAILHDGLAGHKAVEKMYSQVCNRALTGAKDAKKQYRLPLGSSMINIGIQVIESASYLLERNNHLCYYLLTEHENPFLLKKKNKLKDLTKENKYPINHLLGLLEHNLIKDDQTFMDILARVLQVATRPLHVLLKVNKKEEVKPAPFNPPTIPDANYRRIINLLTANECSNTTFRRTISAMQNLSVLGNAQKVFSLELSDKATSLGHVIINDLNQLTKELNGANYSYDNKAMTKFTASSSDQAKLLRILTALDYMFESKDKEKNKEIDSGAEAESKKPSSPIDIEELTGLYKRLALGTLWDALSDSLREIENRQELAPIATVLLPLIEALMVVCKHSKVRDLQKDVVKFEAKKIDFSKEPIERLFFSFTDKHKKILNQMVRTNPNLMSGPFGMLVSNPRVLEFDNKKNYFDRKLHQDKNENSKLAISIRRDQVFLDSYRSLFFKSKEEFKNSKLEVNFKGETGVDAGGVTREWYQVLSRQMFNPDYALFTPVASDETTFHPNRTSFVNPEHLSFFKFIGRIIGKAIHDGSFLDCHFSRAVYKRILSRPVSLKDMETLDLEYFKSLMWMLENDITDVLTEDFSVETDDYGEHKVIDLIPDGRNIPVTEENKQEYVSKVVEYRLQTSVTEQMDNFLIGFHEIIPKDLVSIFDEQELELLISGLPDIDVNDWQNNCTYNNYSPSSLQIQWFWRAVKSFDNEERAKLLQFATGTSKVPLNGFKELSGANGTCKFSIHRDYGTTDRLPSSHTCFNQIDLPAYESYETLRGSLLLAITEGHEGFGLA
ncbi:uncharacterized protein CANTADRAFT_65601 [Suhomyces tanzawaensis NRRL Y-17324]|uniref:HECT-type E3 ubiquitin transferase n=1 Tax=Suhomyces tanzawaensis NRRL Y-17324 TaxID=984487 RepID=A0A1E4SHE1_9ASCO|nr:uncharacterized protein CANTADRAFT_65601 [Suhomyces tanzawaensis NRRL Y-17324]ODV78923.1 hypothetical protein CANTADRAFT_65601 [Suhomyces tanzawaensis NRRL Y-17324]